MSGIEEGALIKICRAFKQSQLNVFPCYPITIKRPNEIFVLWFFTFFFWAVLMDDFQKEKNVAPINDQLT